MVLLRSELGIGGAPVVCVREDLGELLCEFAVVGVCSHILSMQDRCAQDILLRVVFYGRSSL